MKRDPSPSIAHVPSAPSKIPYVGFSPVRLQTGIQPRPSPTGRGLSARPTFTHALRTYTRPKHLGVGRRSTSRSGAKAQSGLLPASRSNPVQRPLAPRWVMLSHQIIAYYGLIRNSRPLPPIYGLYDGSLPYGLVWAGTERLPNLLRASVSTVPPSVPRQAERLQTAVPSPSVLAFAFFAQARHLHSHARRFSRGSCNEAARFALCCGPVESQALHRQGPLRSSFRRTGSPQPTSSITMRANSQFPQPDSHRQDTRPYGLRTKVTKSSFQRSAVSYQPKLRITGSSEC